MSPAVTRPGSAGTMPSSGSGPTPSPRSPGLCRGFEAARGVVGAAPAAHGRPATRPASGSPGPMSCAAGCTAVRRAPDARPVQPRRRLLQVPLPEGIRPRQPRPPPRPRLPPRARRRAGHRPLAVRHLRPAPPRPDHPRDRRSSPAPATAPAQPDIPADTGAVIADCDAKLARYQAALDAGADPQAVARWTRQVEADRAAALARDATQAGHQPGRRLTADNIRALITSLEDLRDVIRDATPAEKTAISTTRAQDHLQARTSKNPGRSDHRPGDIRRACGAMWGSGRVRGGTGPYPAVLYELQR